MSPTETYTERSVFMYTGRGVSVWARGSGVGMKERQGLHLAVMSPKGNQ